VPARYERPASLDDATRLLAGGGWQVLAGGTDVYPAHVGRPLQRPLLDIGGIASLRGIRRTPAGWTIGAATTWTDVLRAELPPLFDALKLAGREVGGVQIQNTATVAGNLCNASPAADGTPVLMALDADVVLRGAGGERRVPAVDFVLGNRRTACAPHELVVGTRGAAVAEHELVDRELAHSARALQDDARAHREQRRRAIGGRRRVAEVAGDRSRVLDLGAADLARRRLQRGEERRQLGAGDVAPGRRRADRPARALVANAAQLGDAADVEHRQRDRPADVRRIEVGAAGEHRP